MRYRMYAATSVAQLGEEQYPDLPSDFYGQVELGITYLVSQGWELASVGYDNSGMPASVLFRTPEETPQAVESSSGPQVW